VCNGLNGTAGLDGQNGADGQNGTDGIDGNSSLIEFTDIAIGADCAAGGIRVEGGSDANLNDQLDEGEITDNYILCNGVDGAEGAMGLTGDTGEAGADGAAGVDGKNSLVTFTEVSPGSDCEIGGVRVETGIDANSDNILQSGEVSDEEYLCNLLSEDLGPVELPKVTGAISIASTAILVSFSQDMGPSALDPRYYEITQTSNLNQVGALPVKAVNYAEEDGVEIRTAVILFTEPQQELSYQIVVTNVRDSDGNQLNVTSGINQFISANQAAFTGTPPVILRICNLDSFGGLSGTMCLTDRDCWDPALEENEFGGGVCVDGIGTFADSDNDSISDDKELLGCLLTIQFANGLTTTKEVTSDPYSVDTDGDTLSDNVN
jgi:hypothetical protein